MRRGHRVCEVEAELGDQAGQPPQGFRFADAGVRDTVGAERFGHRGENPDRITGRQRGAVVVCGDRIGRIGQSAPHVRPSATRTGES